MLAILTELTLRGSLLSGLVWLLERNLASRIQARSRRLWWIIAALAFLFPLRLPILPALPSPTHEWLTALVKPAPGVVPAVSPGVIPATGHRLVSFLPGIWLTGAGLSLAIVVFQTLRTGRRWSRERLCTRPELLDLLEDCKGAAGVTAPIGLVLSDVVPAPALLGWLRPRILLPAELAATLPKPQLRAVLLHELAHFLTLDVPLHWLFTIARALHWFNPLVHLTVRQWLHHRELAADETALRWLAVPERPGYGRALVEALKHAQAFSAPYGALALGESIQNLKQRLAMITRHSSLARRRVFALTISLLLSATALLQPAWADPASDAKAAAATATQSWLKNIDAGHYDKSWQDAAAVFQKAVTSEQWQGSLQQVRTPLGQCSSRRLVSSLYQTAMPQPGGKKLEGEFVIAQYESSYENLSAARETITFTKEADGAWKAAGYFIKPR